MNKSNLNTNNKITKSVVEVKDLKVQFQLKDKVVKAVDGISFNINKGETIAIVGESGSGKSVTALSLMRLTDYSGGKIVSGEINLQSKNNLNLNLTQLDQEKMRDIRGNDISMIFQEPMTSNAVVGSSAINSDGLQLNAIAIITLCLIPPESSCGYWFNLFSGSGILTNLIISSAISKASFFVFP